MNGLTGPTDPQLDHLAYFRVNFRHHPPAMHHSKSDVITTKFMESLPLMRLASGSDLNDHVDPVWMHMALRMIGPDGLLYWPQMPYDKRAPDWSPPVPPGSRHFALPTWNGRMLGAMTIYMLRDPGGPWQATNRGIVDALGKLTVEHDDAAYFPPGAWVPGPNGPRHARVSWKPIGIYASLFGWLIAGLAQFYRHSGYEPARELAAKLSRYLAFHGRYFGPDGEFLPNDGGEDWRPDPATMQGWQAPVDRVAHFQHHATPLLGVADYAIAAGDQQLQEFGVKAFEWGKHMGCDLVGYFPESVGDAREFECSETCEVAAMIGLALKLSAAGIADYWDDADRWIRNQFAENQLLQSDWVYHVAGGDDLHSRMRIGDTVVRPGADTADRVPERNIGAFAGWPSANDWYAGQGYGIMHCCTGNATRALYYIWEHILSYEQGRLRINLLLNRPSAWIDLHSHLPHTGQVDVAVKKPLKDLLVRIPGWVKTREVRGRVNGRMRRLSWDGRYAVIGSVKPGDVVSLTFPIGERKEAADIEKRRYLYTIRGADVVDVFPRGRFFPLYQRNHYRSDTTRWRKIKRFVSDRQIEW